MFHCVIIFLFTLVIYILLMTTVVVDQHGTTSSLAGDTGNKTSTNTFLWNVLVDYGSFSFSVVGIHAFAAFRMAKFCKKLANSLDQTESYLSKYMTEIEHRNQMSKYRKLSLVGIFYISIAVK